VLSKRQQGFTLIEVLIAGVILFMVIASTTLVYRSALLSSNKAQQTLTITGYIPIIADNITEQLQQLDLGKQNKLQGDGRFMDVSYSWQGSLIQAKAAQPLLDGFSGQTVEQAPRYRLWQIDLELNLGTSQKRYQYEDLTYPVLQ